MDANDLEVIEAHINEKHKNQSELCGNIFMKKQTFLGAIWPGVAIAITIIASSIAWALTTSSNVSKIDTMVNSHGEKIKDIEAKFDNIDTKLNKLIELAKDHK